MLGFETVWLEFKWNVPRRGYRWELGEESDAFSEGEHLLVLTDGYPYGISRSMARQIRPLQMDLALHRNFAEVPPERESILVFANEYGRLGGKKEIEVEILHPRNPEGHIRVTGESFKAWRKEIDEIGKAIRAWDTVASDEGETLPLLFCDACREFYFDQAQADEGEFNGDTEAGFIDYETLPPEYREQISLGDFFHPAVFYVTNAVERHLTSSLLLLDITPSPNEKDKLRTSVAPDSLLAAMWCLFAVEIQQGVKYQKCRQCGKWFLQDATAGRPRMYCSDTCRVRAYRDRKVEALRLHSEGFTVEDIAKMLQTSLASARRWIKGGNKP